MCTATTLPTLVAAFTNDRLGLCANVRELSEVNLKSGFVLVKFGSIQTTRDEDEIEKKRA